jgi:hypothetical protein
LRANLLDENELHSVPILLGTSPPAIPAPLRPSRQGAFSAALQRREPRPARSGRCGSGPGRRDDHGTAGAVVVRMSGTRRLRGRAHDDPSVPPASRGTALQACPDLTYPAQEPNGSEHSWKGEYRPQAKRGRSELVSSLLLTRRPDKASAEERSLALAPSGLSPSGALPAGAPRGALSA